ncbi:DUF4136 domain-containing protein [Cytophagaceae bacterium YF14B1]|uniref:DUF4136 domain-containing protein n=1 Tax=Xanthocytophaga flava TaxID=3048013 RepID=A0AAE3QKN4_9BACT|nr:DUF4136 domain-containing protein [Xanthocytophaga flavus]MDJ1481122.1 DUF4136 domain-containing protein [Xanthocytophaga flavus]
MKNLVIVPMLGLLIWLGGCAGSQVVTDQSRDVDLSKYRTFQFADVDNTNKGSENPLFENEIIEQNLHASIARELTDRGMQQTTSNPDVKVAYHTYTEKKRSTGNNYYPMMYGGWGWRYYPWGISPFPYAGRQSYTYTEGTLIIDIIDARTNQLAWRGSIAGTVDNPRTLNRQVEKAVIAIFKKYPVSEESDQEKALSRRK